LRKVYCPQTLEEAWKLLDKPGSPRVYTGGTDLLVQLRNGFVHADYLICLDRMEDFQGVTEDGDNIIIAAGSTHSSIMEDPIASKYCRVLTLAQKTLGSPPIRNMGALGGNIVNASPAGDTLGPLFILEADVELGAKSGFRTMPIAEFIQGPGKTAIKENEILTRVIIPKPEGFQIHHFEKVGLRKGQACAVASLAALMDITPKGEINDIRLAWGSVGPKVVRSKELEDSLKGEPLNRETMEAAIPEVEEIISPMDDIRAGAKYRRIVAGNLLMRLLSYSERCAFK
jgi:CO/xanthine dehydrogenase FAD-binding subunit